MADAMKKQRDELNQILKELSSAQEEMKEKAPDQNRADALDQMAERAESLQKEIDAYDGRMTRLGRVVSQGRKVPDPVLPDDEHEDDPPAQKGRDRPAGFLRLGDWVVAQKAMQQFREAGMPKSQFQLARARKLFAKGEREPLVAVDQKTLGMMLETKAVPTLGDDVIEPQRFEELVRVTEHDMLRLRDVLDIQRTTSDAVKYPRLVSYTRAGATVAHSAQKPEAAMSLDTVTEAVRTIAVHTPVEEQQLSDLPQLAGIINGELLYDVNKHVEELVIWGDGQGENFLGICQDPDVLDCRTVGGDTLIDIARRGITDVRRAGYSPNAILADPLDWEEIVLEKGSDNRYVWVVVTDGATQRLWAVPVIETEAMEDFAGNETEARNLLVGDFARGCTLWDREDAAISVGWINDQFIRNQRTILAELRAAFGVKRPGAFRKHETQEAVAS